MTQNQTVLKVLKSGKSLTAAQAKQRYKIKCLSARISDLRNHEGHTNIVTGETRQGAASYRMV